MSGMIVERLLHVLTNFFSFFAFIALTFFRRWSSTKNPFFKLLAIFQFQISECGFRICQSSIVNRQSLSPVLTFAGSIGGQCTLERITGLRIGGLEASPNPDNPKSFNPSPIRSSV